MIRGVGKRASDANRSHLTYTRYARQSTVETQNPVRSQGVTPKSERTPQPIILIQLRLQVHHEGGDIRRIARSLNGVGFAGARAEVPIDSILERFLIELLVHIVYSLEN